MSVLLPSDIDRYTYAAVCEAGPLNFTNNLHLSLSPPPSLHHARSPPNPPPTTISSHYQSTPHPVVMPFKYAIYVRGSVRCRPTAQRHHPPQPLPITQPMIPPPTIQSPHSTRHLLPHHPTPLRAASNTIYTWYTYAAVCEAGPEACALARAAERAHARRHVVGKAAAEGRGTTSQLHYCTRRSSVCVCVCVCDTMPRAVRSTGCASRRQEGNFGRVVHTTYWHLQHTPSATSYFDIHCLGLILHLRCKIGTLW